MIPNDTKRLDVYDRLRKLTSGRISRALDLEEGDLVNLSLAQLIDLLFLIHGDTGSTGNFNVSLGAAVELVGAERIWHQREIEKVSVSQFVQ